MKERPKLETRNQKLENRNWKAETLLIESMGVAS
jgi:hypothetical protein